jgi:hypothetical protein
MTKTMSRRAFDALSDQEKSEKMRDKYTLFDEAPAKKLPVVPGSNEMLREDFDKLSAKDKTATMKAAIKLIDS